MAIIIEPKVSLLSCNVGESSRQKGSRQVIGGITMLKCQAILSLHESASQTITHASPAFPMLVRGARRGSTYCTVSLPSVIVVASDRQRFRSPRLMLVVRGRSLVANRIRGGSFGCQRWRWLHLSSADNFIGRRPLVGYEEMRLLGVVSCL